MEELNAIRKTYNPREIYDHDPLIRVCLDTLSDGTFPDHDGSLAELRDSLLSGASWHQPDHYFILKDFPSYLETKLQAICDAGNDPETFAHKCLMNVACAGKFSSDRTIRQYAAEIWNVSIFN